MASDFLHTTLEAESPIDAILADMDLYGEAYWKHLDNTEFLLHYGITKDQFLFEFNIGPSATAKDFVNTQQVSPFTDSSLDRMMDELKKERKNHESSAEISESKPASESKTTESQPAQQTEQKQANDGATSPATSTNKPAAQTESEPQTQKNKPNTTIHIQRVKGPEFKARKEFEKYKRQLVMGTRGSFARKAINLREKALKRKLEDDGTVSGSEDWVKTVKDFFPDAPIAATVASPKTKAAPAPATETKTETPVAAPQETVSESTPVTPATSATSATPENSQDEKSAEVANKETAKSKQANAAQKAKNAPQSKKQEAPQKNSDAKAENQAQAAPSGGGGSGGGDLTINKQEDTLAKTEAVAAKTDSLEKPQDILTKGSEKAFTDGVNKIAKTASKQQTTKSAEEKRAETEMAVEPPKEESVSDVNTGAVEAVNTAPEPPVDASAPKRSVASKMEAQLPTSADDVKKLKDSNPAKKAASEMNQLISKQTAGVSQTYKKIEDTAAPVQKQAEAPLPAPEETPQMEQMNLGEGLIPPTPAEQTDFTEYVEESENLIKNELQDPKLMKEFETSDAEPMVAAREAKGEIDAEAEAAPKEEQANQEAVVKETQSEASTAEKQATTDMTQQRKQGLAQAQSTQEGSKSEFELERQKVSEHINKIYETANDRIKDKLKLLEIESMQAFDIGQTKAFAAFEAGVDKDLEDFFEERHSGIGGFFTAIGDWFSGTDDLPEVQAIFQKHRTIFISSIDQLIEDITANSKKVIDECKTILSDARAEIDTYVSGLEGKLKDVGKNCQDDVSKKLDKLEGEIKKKEEELKKKLAELRKKAIEGIDKRIEERKESMKGALSKFGDLALDLAMKFFKFTLESMGMSADSLMAMINKGIDAVTKIITDPMGFFSNLGSAVGKGLNQFKGNFKKHMIGGMLEWLTGAMGGMVEIPQDFSLKSMIKFGLSILGLTWPNIRAKLVKHLGENIVSVAETGFEIVTVLIKEGPLGLWEWIKEQAEQIKQSVIESIKEWALTAIVKSAVMQIAMMLNPAGAIVRAIVAIYDLIMWLKDNIQRILSFVNSVVDSIANIAAGNIGGAANFIENAIARTIPMILSGLAQFLKLGGIAKKIQEAIKKVRKPIDNAMDKGIGFVVKKVKKWFGKKKGKNANLETKKDPKASSKEKNEADKKLKEELAIIKKGLKKDIANELKKGYGEKAFKKKLKQWKSKYKLTELKLKGDKIFLKLNPEDDFQAIQSITLGTMLLPVLAEAEKDYYFLMEGEAGFQEKIESEKQLLKDKKPGNFDDNAADINQAVLSGAELPAPEDGKKRSQTKVSESTSISSTTDNAPATMKVESLGKYDAELTHIRGYVDKLKNKKLDISSTEIETTVQKIISSSDPAARKRYINSLISYIETKEKDFNKAGNKSIELRKGISDLIASLQNRVKRLSILVQSLEPIRQDGMAATTALEHQIAKNSGDVKLEDQISKDGKHGTMTSEGASMKEKEKESKARKEKREKADEKRKERTGNIFKDFVKMAGDAEVLVPTDGGYDLKYLEKYLRKWVKQKLDFDDISKSDPKKAEKAEKEIARTEDNFKTEIIYMMLDYNGRIK